MGTTPTTPLASVIYPAAFANRVHTVRAARRVCLARHPLNVIQPYRGKLMISDKWTVLFTQFRTRTEVRGVLSSTLTNMMDPAKDATKFPSEICDLSTGNDREVMESYLRVKIFCDGKKGKDRGSVAAGIAGDVRELFAKALERMKELPPEPITLARIDAVRYVRRA